MGLIWLRIWTRNVLLLKKKFHKMWKLLKQFGQKEGKRKCSCSCVTEHDAMKAHTEIIIIIIIFIYCSWVVTRWQWLFYMYTKHEIGY